MREDTTTTVRVSRRTWERLKARKAPGLSYDEIIEDLLDESEGVQKAEN